MVTKFIQITIFIIITIMMVLLWLYNGSTLSPLSSKFSLRAVSAQPTINKRHAFTLLKMQKPQVLASSLQLPSSILKFFTYGLQCLLLEGLRSRGPGLKWGSNRERSSSTALWPEWQGGCVGSIVHFQIFQPGINSENHWSSSSNTGKKPDHPESRPSPWFWRTSWSRWETEVLQPLDMLVIGGDGGLLWEEVVHFSGFGLEHPAKAWRLGVKPDKVILQPLGHFLSWLQTRPGK